MILLPVPAFIFILNPPTLLYVEIIHDNIDNRLESISPLTTASKTSKYVIDGVLWRYS